MITGQLSKPLLSLRSDMSAAELRADEKAATPDSDLNDEPLLLPSESMDREGTPNKLYEADDEISFNPDDIITNIEMIDEGWWRGSCGGRVGLFPAAYVKLMQ